MKHTVSYKKIGLLLKNDLLLHRRSIMLLVLAMTGIVFLLGMCVMSGLFGDGKDMSKIFSLTTLQNRAIMVSSYASYVVYIASFVVVTRVFVNMEHRYGDIEYLTMPATNFEKWLARVFYVLWPWYSLYLPIMQVSPCACWLLGCSTRRLLLSYGISIPIRS